MAAALMVSVSGVRGIVSESLTPAVALEFAQAYGTWLGRGRVVLGRDTRPSGGMFEDTVAAGLTAAGCTVTRVGVQMTPTIGRTIRAGGFAGGMCITASHNPGEWNGLKFLDDQGLAPDPERARRIAEIRTAGAYALLKSGFAPTTVDDRAGERHVEAVLAACEVDLAKLRGVRVVLDCINGAGARHTPDFLRQLGCEAAVINGEPNGEFAHRPEPLRENLGDLCRAVREQRAAIGFAQDPDADRLALVDERGEYIGEEYTLALAAWSVLSRRRGTVAANLSTSRMIDDVAGRFGVRVFRTPVGEAHVARRMMAEGCVAGGEGNGGVIDPRICYVRDSLSAISLVLQLMAATGKPLSELAGSLPRYASIKQKLEIPRERMQAVVREITTRFAEREPNTEDGVRVDFPAGWVHVRASNTEPILRIIGEASSEAAATDLVAKVRRAAGL